MVSPRNFNEAQIVFVVKRRSGTALDDGNRMWLEFYSPMPYL